MRVHRIGARCYRLRKKHKATLSGRRRACNSVPERLDGEGDREDRLSKAFACTTKYMNSRCNDTLSAQEHKVTLSGRKRACTACQRGLVETLIDRKRLSEVNSVSAYG